MYELNGSVIKDGNLLISPCTDDYELAKTYIEFHEQGILKYWFHQGIPNLSFFVARMLESQSVCLKTEIVENGYKRIIGLGHVDKPMATSSTRPYTKSELSEAFVRCIPPQVTLHGAELMIEYAFLVTGCRVFYGTTPERNRAALRFMKALGFEYMKEPLPYYTSYNGEECGVILSWMTRERWQEKEFSKV